MFDKLKDAEAFVETLEGKYWQIVRQEYSGFSYGEEKVIKKGYNPRKEL
jgi:type IV secretory pathway VirB4 component